MLAGNGSVSVGSCVGKASWRISAVAGRLSLPSRNQSARICTFQEGVLRLPMLDVIALKPCTSSLSAHMLSTMPLTQPMWRTDNEKNTYQIRAIRTEADHQAALQQVASYFDVEPEIDSEAGAHFEAMITLIEAYEAKHYPIAPPDPIEAVKFRMEQQGLKQRLATHDWRAESGLRSPQSEKTTKLVNGAAVACRPWNLRRLLDSGNGLNCNSAARCFVDHLKPMRMVFAQFLGCLTRHRFQVTARLITTPSG